MRKLAFTVIVGIILFSCRQQTKAIEDEITNRSVAEQTLKSEYKVVLNVGNDNISSIGFLQVEGEAIGVGGICMFHDKIVLTDPIHKNLKIVDLITSEVTISKELDDGIQQIIEFNNSLYVFSSSGRVFLFDKNFTLSNELNLEFGSKGILNVSDTNITFFNKFDGRKSKRNGVSEVILSRLDRKNTIINDTLEIPNKTLDEYRLFGKEYKYLEREGEIMIKTSSFEILLPRRDLEITSYDTQNYFFNNDSFCFFYYDNNNLIIKSLNQLTK